MILSLYTASLFMGLTIELWILYSVYPLLEERTITGT